MLGSIQLLPFLLIVSNALQTNSPFPQFRSRVRSTVEERAELLESLRAEKSRLDRAIDDVSNTYQVGSTNPYFIKPYSLFSYLQRITDTVSLLLQTLFVIATQ